MSTAFNPSAHPRSNDGTFTTKPHDEGTAVLESVPPYEPAYQPLPWGPDGEGGEQTGDITAGDDVRASFRGARDATGAETWTGSYDTEFAGQDATFEFTEVEFGDLEDADVGPDATPLDTGYVRLRAVGRSHGLTPVVDVELDMGEVTTREELFTAVGDAIDEHLQDAMVEADDYAREDAMADRYRTMRDDPYYV